MDTANIILLVLLSALWILTGVFIVLTCYELENPIWKLPAVIFWPITLIILGVTAFLRHISDIIFYYQDRRKEKNDKDISI